MNEIINVTTQEIAADNLNAQELYIKNLKSSMSAATFRAYASQLRTFGAWCEGEGVSAFPAEPYTVARYIEHLKATGHKLNTVKQFAAAITKQHRTSGYTSPCDSDYVKTALRASTRELGTAVKPKAAITSDVLGAILSVIDRSVLKGKRDAALLAVGFMGAFRRSELTALKVSDLETVADKTGRACVLITVRRSKTDQTGEGMTKAIFSESKACDAVFLLKDWIRAAALSGDSVLFPSVDRYDNIGKRPMSGYAVSLIIKKRAAAAGVVLDVSGHSLRRGFVTSAVEAGCSERSIMNQTGHRSAAMVRRYIERHDVMTDNAAAMI